jgi:hypothetical protein
MVMPLRKASQGSWILACSPRPGASMDRRCGRQEDQCREDDGGWDQQSMHLASDRLVLTVNEDVKEPN